ncbi:MAG TPA: hypothetical protein VNA16_03850 [Abditibacteriaceae bacterium]|nr:hypothetical protein [Abditibacteriaceae bacterium]
MPGTKTGVKDTTIKDKGQPVDVTDDAGDVQAASDEILRTAANNVEGDEDALSAPRPDGDKERNGRER